MFFSFLIMLLVAQVGHTRDSEGQFLSPSAAPDSMRSALSIDQKIHLFLAEPRCGNFVKMTDRLIIQGFGPYLLGAERVRQPIPGFLTLTSKSERFILPSHDSVVDALVVGENLWVLTYTGLEKWDLNSMTRLESYPLFEAENLQRKQHAQQMALWGNTLVIAQGRKGLAQFDLMTSRWLRTSTRLVGRPGLESMAVGLAIRGDEALVLMDNFHIVADGSRPAFRGFVKFNLQTWQVKSRAEGLDPGASWLSVQPDRTLVSFMGRPIWSYPTEVLFSQTKLFSEPHRIWKYFANGVELDGHPTGRPWIEGQYIYTCFYESPRFRGDNGGFFRRIPKVLNRYELML